MLKVEGRMELAVLPKHGASIRELARVTGHSRNTVRRYLRGGEMSVSVRQSPLVRMDYSREQVHHLPWR